MANKQEKLGKLKIIILLCSIALVALLILDIITVSHSEEKVLEKLIAGIDHLNYTYTIDNNNGEKAIEKVIGKKMKEILSNGEEHYVDYEKKETIIVYTEAQHKEKITNEGITEMPYYQEVIKPYFNNEFYQYQYLGKKTMNSQKYIVIEFKDKEMAKGRYVVVRLWIEPNLYLVEKMETYLDYDGDEMIMVDEKEYHYHTNENKLEDVQIPKAVESFSSNTNN